MKNEFAVEFIWQISIAPSKRPPLATTVICQFGSMIAWAATETIGEKVNNETVKKTAHGSEGKTAAANPASSG